MKFLNAIICLPVVTASSALAETKLLDDSELADQVAQAGLTIDIEHITNINAFENANNHLMNMPLINVGGHGHNSATGNPYYTDHLDNIRVNVNQTRKGDLLSYGFSGFRDMAKLYLDSGNKVSEEEFEKLLSGRDARRQLAVDDERLYEEGDLVIRYGFLDLWEKDGGLEAFRNGEGLSGLDFTTGSIAHAEHLMGRAVDFSYSFNDVDTLGGHSMLNNGSLNATNNNSLLGSGGSDGVSTRLMSDFSVEGYLGPNDIHVEQFASHNDVDPEAIDNIGITWNSYFRITDLDVYQDVKGTQISNVQVHNDRGDLSGLNLDTQDSSVGNSSFGFAHAQREIYTLQETAPDVHQSSKTDKEKEEKERRDAMAFNTRFKGDIDIGHLSFGDSNVSVGKFYMTDMYFKTNMTVLPRE